MTDPTPTDQNAVANSQPVDAVAASGADGDAVAPTTGSENVTTVQPDAPVLGEDGEPVNPNAPVVPDTLSDTVGGPEVVTEAEAASEQPASEPFDGLTPVSERVEQEQATAAYQTDNAADTRAVAAAQRQADLDFQTENPDSPIVRAANPNVGGERF